MASDDDVLPKPRKLTDCGFLIIFFIIFIAYIGIATYAFVAGDEPNILLGVQYNKTHHELFDIDEFSEELLEDKWIFFGMLMISLIITGCVILLTKVMPIGALITGLVVETIMTLSLISFEEGHPVDSIIEIIILIIYTIVRTYAIKYVGTRLISAVFKESCRAIFAFPWMVFMPYIIVLLASLILVFSITINLCLNTINSNPTTFLKECSMSCFLFLTFCLLTFNAMVQTRTYATWFRTTDKSDISTATFWNCFSTILRYNLGTISYVATVICPFITLIWVTIKNISSFRRNSRRHNIMIMIVCWIYAVQGLIGNVIAACAIRGTSFHKTADTTCKMYYKKSLHFLAMFQALECYLGFLGFTVTILCTFTHYGFFVKGKEYNFIEELALITVIIISILPSISLLTSAVITTTFCTFEDFEETDGSNLNSDLKQLMELE